MKKKFLALSLAAALGVSLLSGCTQDTAPSPSPSASTPAEPSPSQTVSETYTYADTVAWDGRYDVVIVGFGGAGSMAAMAAADEGARVLLVEKAPEGHEGGNTRYCGQLFANGNGNYEDTLAYYKALAGDHEIPEAMLELYAREIANLADTISDKLGLNKEEFMAWNGIPVIGSMSPEYPEFPGSDSITLTSTHAGISDGYLWQAMRKQVTDRADKIDVWFESPAVSLVQDPASKTILGVTVERGGEKLNVRADNGVVLTLGGFENNPEMLADYLGLTDSRAIGTLYNTGDGIDMVLDVGADLWHMEAYEGIGDFSGSVVKVPEGERGTTMFGSSFTQGGSIFIAGDGNRYLREDELTRHGHIKLGDAWMNARRPLRSFVICDETQFNAFTMPENAVNVQSASSIADLAALIDVDADTLVKTVENYNSYAKAGYDPQFGRSAESMAPITGGTYYAVELTAAMLNTQGGARRNENAEVLDRSGNPIPHLYSAGEFGGITAFQYQGGGNIAECVIFGQIAGKNAAAVKNDTLPAYTAAEKVTSNIVHTPGVTTDLAASEAPDVTLGENEYLGVSHNGMGGDLYVKVTMDGDKISTVEIVQHAETDGISDPARDQIPGAIVEANSTEVDNVSGATITSKAIKEAVEDALSQVK